MIDDQSAVLGFQTIFKAKTMKQMRKSRDAILSSVLKQQCREVAETAIKEMQEEKQGEQADAAGPSPQSETETVGKEVELEELAIDKMQQSRVTNEVKTSQTLGEGDITSINIPYQPSDIYHSQCYSPSKENESCKNEQTKVKISEFAPEINKDDDEVVSERKVDAETPNKDSNNSPQDDDVPEKI